MTWQSDSCTRALQRVVWCERELERFLAEADDLMTIPAQRTRRKLESDVARARTDLAYAEAVLHESRKRLEAAE